ncbi:hypothetical protein MMC16_002886 [Acarospora aff. strigata]|nr:hypothetical protein [Acarospora aff. strigata]
MTTWWTEAQIDARVNRDFVSSKLHPEEQALLDKPLAFGDGLTDNTYIEWIVEKSRKLFLILLDIGVPEQVFGVIDDSFDDDDLPLSSDTVSQLKLSLEPDEALNERFYRTQYHYLVRHLNSGEHGRYGVDEVVPVEPVKKRSEVLPNHSSERVHLAGNPTKVYARRKISIGYTAGGLPEEDFLAEIDGMKAISHDHIMSLWASYTHCESGYILLAPAPDVSLKSFITDVPQQFKTLPKQRRREILLNWPHCLADALAFLHWNGYAHQDIRPSNVFVDPSNNIFLGDISSAKLRPQQTRKKSNESDAYEYAAPEQWVKTSVVQQSSVPRSTGPGGGRTGRKKSVTSAVPSRRSSYVSDAASLASFDTGCPSTTTTTSSSSSSSGSAAIVQKYRSLPTDPQRSDIFSLACIFLDILTHLLKRKHTNFASHRSSKNRSAGRGGAPADASFHVNLTQVCSWLDILDGDAFSKDDQLFRGVPPMLACISKMLTRDPKQRPTAAEVEARLDDALFRFAHVEKPHCGTRHFANGDGDPKVGYKNNLCNGRYGMTPPEEYNSRTMSVASSFAGGPPISTTRASSKSSRSSGSTVRAKTWPLKSADEIMGYFGGGRD